MDHPSQGKTQMFRKGLSESGFQQVRHDHGISTSALQTRPPFRTAGTRQPPHPHWSGLPDQEVGINNACVVVCTIFAAAGYAAYLTWRQQSYWIRRVKMLGPLEGEHSLQSAASKCRRGPEYPGACQLGCNLYAAVTASAAKLQNWYSALVPLPNG
jgi:hypothetical protein